MSRNEREIIDSFIKQISKYHLGDLTIVKKILAVYFSGGNLLLNDVPGTGKSHLSTIIAKSIDVSMKRVQFTSDLMASDLVGVKIYNMATKEWETSKGPVFSDIVFADEINRAPPQTQSALLEAMSEKQITIEGETFKLSKNHFVMATQNPNEFDGTYPLPEAQLDRFSACLTLGYLSEHDEIQVIMGNFQNLNDIKPVLNHEDVDKIKEDIEKVNFHQDIAGVIVKILSESRQHAKNKMIKNGLSIRAGIALKEVSKAYAYILGLDAVYPDLIFELAGDVLKHRVNKPEVIDEILNNVKGTVYDKTR